MNQNFSLFEFLQTPVWIFDIHQKRILWANAASLSLWEAETTSELTARDLSLDMSEAVDAILDGYLSRFHQGEKIKTWWYFSPNDMIKKALCYFSGMPGPDGSTVMLVEVIAEEASLRRELAFSGSSNLALLFEEDGHLISANNSFTHSFGEDLNDLASFLGDAQLAEKWLATARSEGVLKSKRLCWTGKSHNWLNIDGKWLSDKHQLLLSLINISQEKEQLHKAKYNAEHDFLTGLLNRRGITNAIIENQHSQHPYSLLFLDIDGFKLVNDTYGHAIGDKLLRAIAIRLQEEVKFKGLLARFGGDEFIVQAEHRNIDNSALFAKQLIKALNRPFHLKEVGELSIGCSIGTSDYPTDAKDIETLVTQADMAMHRAKLRGRNRSHHFSPDMADALYRKMTLRHHLTLALEAEAFELYYQPIVDMNSKSLKGFEALIRWHDEELGQVSPGEFIPLAEETGQIVPLGKWILKTACKQLALWEKKYGKSFIMSVNLSRAQLQSSLAPTIEGLLNQYQIPSSQLALELTESTMLQEYDEAKQCLDDLASLGLELYLDDFGTGYSSLSQLQDLPISTVKLDQSFVQGEHKGSQAIIEATQAICEKLALKVVAEGVETKAQLRYLQQCGFDFCQGYYLGRPLPAHEHEERNFSLLNEIPELSPEIV
ncbi:putative bifunctional diguanylate cyclase/phosphodiesterase [Photobacterium sp. DNB23_23_1]|uniref:EAL domain-containing protein n=1 Tax=Photobacterium pectinilyticum TaxID=2906793 RepID=A0ABT1MYX0_9GAMM|nr:EAL domain-containing protein [Photobacterium sp. ZSDE20]MCQ1057691.1 EAL domain-containing protein [Photobacterium sp. ZSDE20]MDD1822098.1 EAL domain-containing protein [Photobacterium sp. ZSDE20]